MDDPWGSSPWAEDGERRDELEKITIDLGNTGVEKAAGAVKGRIEEAWGGGTEAHFGDWAQDAGSPVLAFGGTFDGVDEGWNTQRQDTAEWIEAKRDVPDAQSTPALLGRPAEILRQASPDPWAHVAAEDALPVADAEEKAPEKLESDVVTSETPLNDEVLCSVLGDLSTAATTTQDDALDAQAILDSVPGGSAKVENPSTDSSSGDLRDADALVDDAESTTPQEVQENDHESSRPSSSPSDHSHHGIIESSRTSLDEEPRRPSYVQKLVERFDSLAKVEEVVTLPAQTEGRVPMPVEVTPITPEPDDEDDEFGDFGDFEEGLSDDETAQSLMISSGKTSAIQVPDVVTEKHKSALKRTYKSAEFDIDLSALSELYPNSNLPEVAIESIFIPDTMIHDAFCSVEERKTWYRISRYGTMRKHNTGDDENYVRVGWAKSHIKTETLKVVARWMEEDRNSGRVILGGGSKGSSIFGWNDANASPMAISSAFAVKRGKERAKPRPVSEAAVELPREWPKGLLKEHSRSRSTSKSGSTSKARRQSLSKPVEFLPEPKSVVPVHQVPAVQTPSTHFSWSSPAGDQFPSLAETSKPAQTAAHFNDVSFSQLAWSSPTFTEPFPTSVVPPRAEAELATLDRKIIPRRTSSLSRGSRPSVTTSNLDKKFEILAPISSPTLVPGKFEPDTPIATGQAGLPYSIPQVPADTDILSIQTFSTDQSSVPVYSSGLVPPTTAYDDEDDWGEMVSSPVVSEPTPPKVLSQLSHQKSGSLSMAFPSMSSPPASNQPKTRHRPSMSFDEILKPKPHHESTTSGKASATTPLVPSFTNDAPIVEAPSLTTVDPWASADFSFFDAPSQLPPPVPKKSPILKPATKARPLSTPPMSKTVTFNTASAPRTSSPLNPQQVKQLRAPTQKEQSDEEQDRLVRSVVEALPDLSYMFKR